MLDSSVRTVPVSSQEEPTVSFDGNMEQVCAWVKDGRRLIAAEGLKGSSRSLFLAHLWKTLRRPLAVIVADAAAGETLLGDLTYFLKQVGLKTSPQLFPDWELLPYEPLSPLSETSGERLHLLHGMMAGERPLLILPVESCMQCLMPKKTLQDMTYRVKRRDNVDRELLEVCLVDNGYVRSHMVEERGQFSLRGDILDLYLPAGAHPVRLEFFGDEVESVRHFDVTSQISFEEIEQVDILPVREICLTDKQNEAGLQRLREFAEQAGPGLTEFDEIIEKIECLKTFSGIEWLAPFFYEESTTLFDYMSSDTLLVLDEPDRIQEKVEAYHGLILEEYSRRQAAGALAAPPDTLFLDPDRWQTLCKERVVLELTGLQLNEESRADRAAFDVKPLPVLYNHFEGFATAAAQWEKQGMAVTVAAPTKGHVQRIQELLMDRDLAVRVDHGRISAGFILPGSGAVLVGEQEIFGRAHKHRQRRRNRVGRFQRGFQDLKKGDLLVHVDYGIGKYMGARDLKTGVGGGEFLEIQFADDGRLYIPMDGLGAIQKYGGSGDTPPPLNKLGGVTWKRQKKKVKEAIRKMAEELVKIYASRQLAESQVYHPDPILMQEFADSFEYVETEDQLKAIEDIMADLETGKPMDRLVCGDVGYGKTEVAMRAAFKVVLGKKQVAVLVPTTLLAQQHLTTFRERFRNWPVTIDMVSRFRTPRQHKETLKKLAAGNLDIIIGTHRLLSKDVKFADLGLAIVDEEQRFGVRHKEHLKKLRSSVDILTLTATPIPRTLHFSMMGIRDLSVIETPPSDRLAIKTYIRRFDEGKIREAVLRELDRGGQIFFVHNKVQGIHSMAALIQRVVPEVRIGIVHGQMQETMLENTMRRFMEKEIDLLLCTSIVESGLDIPTANTIIINRADRFGLGQLYQLRGRVGRFKHQAYAYLLIPGMTSISEEARKRLVAIEEMAELGAGIQLATRDLEIRGAGNMLGKNQSGHIAAIGFDLYCQMMEETIREMKGEKVESRIETEVDLQVRGYLPKDHVPDLNQRLEIYRRLQTAAAVEDLKDLRAEMKDRYGPAPEPVEKLFALVDLQLLCRRLHIVRARWTRNHLTLEFGKGTPVDPQRLVAIMAGKMRMVSEFKGVLDFKQMGWREDARRFKDSLQKIINSVSGHD